MIRPLYKAGEIVNLNGIVFRVAHEEDINHDLVPWWHEEDDKEYVQPITPHEERDMFLIKQLSKKIYDYIDEQGGVIFAPICTDEYDVWAWWDVGELYPQKNFS